VSPLHWGDVLGALLLTLTIYGLLLGLHRLQGITPTMEECGVVEDWLEGGA